MLRHLARWLLRKEIAALEAAGDRWRLLYEREVRDYMQYAMAALGSRPHGTLTEIRAKLPAGIEVLEIWPGQLAVYAELTIAEVKEAFREYERRRYCRHRAKADYLCQGNHHKKCAD